MPAGPSEVCCIVRRKGVCLSLIHLLHSCPQTTFSAGKRSFSGVTKGITVAVPDSVAPFFRSLSVISFLCWGAKWQHYEVAFVCFCVCGDPVEWTGRGPENGLQTPLQSPENHSQMVIVQVPWSMKSMHEIFLFALLMKFLVAVKLLKGWDYIYEVWESLKIKFSR